MYSARETDFFINLRSNFLTHLKGDTSIRISLSDLQVAPVKYSFQLADSFLQPFEQEEMEDLRADLSVSVLKTGGTIEVSFEITGSTTLICDRSAESFSFPLEVKEKIYLKLGDHFEELSEDVLLVPAAQHELEVTQYVYDFLMLAIPSRKIHPRFAGEDNSDEDEVLIYSSEPDAESDTEVIPDDAPDASVDPRWEALKKLKKSQN